MHFAVILLALICDIAALKGSDTKLYRAGERFSVTGHVISSNPQSRKQLFWSKPHSFMFYMTNNMVHARGDVLYRLDGHLFLWGGWKRQIVAERLAPVETNMPPVPLESTTARVAGGLENSRLVRLAGTIVRVAEDEADLKYCWLTLKNEEGSVAVACLKQHIQIASLTPLIGAKVRIVGVPTRSATWRSLLPPTLMLSAVHPIDVLEPAETDPEKLPKFISPQTIGRQRISGTVIANAKDGFYVRFLPNNQGMRLALVRPAAGQAVPAIGESVVVAGFASLYGYHIQFDESLLKIARQPSHPGGERDGRNAIAESLSIPDLFTDKSGNAKIDANRHGSLVSIVGTVRDMPPLSAEGRRLVVEDGGHRVGIETELIDIPEWVEIGSVIEATGILAVEYEEGGSAYDLPRFRRFSLLPRDRSDFRLIHRAPLWTPQRLCIVIIALLVVILWIGIWNRALRRLAEKRGEELYRERIAHKAAELKVAERTRLAVEIHDSISQTLTGIALQLENGADEAVVRQMLASCRHELKSCLWDLRSRTFEEKDMTEAVRRAIGPNAGSAKVDVRFNVPRSDLSETTTHAILRIVRELVVNAVRHGRATEVKVAGECHNGTISFSVRDNGAGFDPSSAAGPATGHFGLQGIRERIAEFRGSMAIDTAPGQGTRISVILNLATPSTTANPSRKS